MVRSCAIGDVDQSRAAPMAAIFLHAIVLRADNWRARMTLRGPDFEKATSSISRARAKRGCSAIGPTYIDIGVTAGAVFTLLANQRCLKRVPLGQLPVLSRLISLLRRIPAVKWAFTRLRPSPHGGSIDVRRPQTTPPRRDARCSPLVEGTPHLLSSRRALPMRRPISASATIHPGRRRRSRADRRGGGFGRDDRRRARAG